MTYDDLLTRLEKILTGPGGEVAVAAPARALPRRARRRVPGHRPGAVGHRAPGVRRGARRSCSSATPSRPSTRSAAPTSTPTSRRRGRPATSATLEVNWRSDQGLLDAYDALFGGARLGHEGIVYRSVRAADATARRACSARRVRSRCGCASCTATTRRSRGPATATRATTPRAAHVAHDLAADLVALLASGARIERRAEDGAVLGHEPVRPGHVAVLVRTHRQAALVRDALDAVEIPAVINGAGSVFGTAPASDWLRLLEAIERPTRPPAPAPPRSPRSSAGRRARRGRRRGRVGGGPPAAARVGARAARARRRGAARDDHARRGPARAGARRGRTASGG